MSCALYADCCNHPKTKCGFHPHYQGRHTIFGDRDKVKNFVLNSFFMNAYGLKF